MRRGAETGGINAEKFGSFLALLRREKKMTQKELAEKMFVTNKAVSKWERGLSLPDIALLEPLADTFGVTVTELLHGERFRSGEEAAESELTESVSGELMGRLEVNAEENRQALRRTKRKRALYYIPGAILSLAELALLYLQGYRAGITGEQVSTDVLLSIVLPLFFGIWFFFFIREKLPAYYDTERISYYADGVLRMNVPGVYFNNRNWPAILKAGRGYCFLTPILYPLLYVILRLLVPAEIWKWASLWVQLTVVLGGLFLPITIAAKRKD
ncbi:MAG: helix-turn-helix domain-containing protein [Roseburia sp.]|nr:helix-turn-helix domain-containing protein [Roseburia sp.]MCM1099445.1 helix-turn-helix domain-containing protein [Ruminococcus flavefaciens]